MNRKLIALTLGLLFTAASSAFAQGRPGGPGAGPGGPNQGGRGNSEEAKKLLAEIEKLQAEIKEAEAQIRSAQGRKEEPRPIPQPGGNRPESGGPKGPGGFGPGGFGQGGFGPGGGFGSSSGFGSGTMGIFGGGSRGGNDVKSLEAQLDQLKAAGKQIAERTRDVEARLKQAKEDEARSAKQPGKSERKAESRASSDVEKRLDRIEQTLQEIQNELRRKK